MREIRFRYVTEENGIPILVKDPFDVYLNLVDGFIYTFDGWDEISKKVEQFTGLHDKNGVPIYEGDILRNKIGVTAEVKFSPEQAAFTASYKFQNLSGEEYLAKDVIEMCEVIGNIHENPELLNG